MITEASQLPHLAPSETEIWRLTANGLLVKEIAAQTNRTEQTVRTMRRNLYKKLGVKDVVACVRIAYRVGLCQP